MFVASSSKPPSSSSLTVRHGFFFFHRGQPFSHYKLTALQTCCSCCLSPVPRSLLQTPSPQHDNLAMTSRRPHDNLTTTSQQPHAILTTISQRTPWARGTCGADRNACNRGSAVPASPPVALGAVGAEMALFCLRILIRDDRNLI